MITRMHAGWHTCSAWVCYPKGISTPRASGRYAICYANAPICDLSGLKYTDDHSDARWLAHLLRLGVLPEGYIYPKGERAVRDLLRKRAHLVRQHTANVLSVQNIMARYTGARFSVKRMQALTKQDLTTLLAEEAQVLAVTSSLVVLD